MKIEHFKIEPEFGPIGSFAGIVVFIAGIIALPFFHSGMVLLIIGAFTGFSYSGTFVDFDHKRIKFSHVLFGCIRTGRWVDLQTDMGLGISRTNTIWRAYSQSNRSMYLQQRDFRILLYSKQHQPLMPVKKCASYDSAESDRNLLCTRLELKPVNNQI